MKATSISRYGGPDVIELIDAEEPLPGPGEVSITVTHDGRPRRPDRAAEGHGCRPRGSLLCRLCGSDISSSANAMRAHCCPVPARCAVLKRR